MQVLPVPGQRPPGTELYCTLLIKSKSEGAKATTHTRGQGPPLVLQPGSRATAGTRLKRTLGLATRRGARATSVGALTFVKRSIAKVVNTEEAQGVVPLVHWEALREDVRRLILCVDVLYSKRIVVE